MRKAFRNILTLFAVLGLSWPVAAEDWVMVETRELPSSCADPMNCDDPSRLLFRNFLSLRNSEKSTFSQLLNSMSTIRGVPDDVTLPACRKTVEKAAHPPPVATKPELLAGHPGVYFDSTRIDGMDIAAGFSGEVRERLAAAGVTFLTEEEWQATPGRPALSLNFSARKESAGCIIPFSVSLSIKEEVLLVRNTGLKTTTSIWAGSVRQNLTSTNYQPANALDDLVVKFLADWGKANPGG